MSGLTISDRSADGVLSVGLEDIIRVLGPNAENSEWEVSGVEAADGPAAEKLYRLADAKARIPGGLLLQLASEVAQVIDGVFRGYRKGETEPWIVIRAVDSSAFDVLSDDERLLEQFRRTFRNVEDLPLGTE